MTPDKTNAQPAKPEDDPVSEPIAVTGVTVLDETGTVVLSKATGVLLFTDVPTLTLIPGLPSGGGPKPEVPCYATFTEAGFTMHLNDLYLTSDPTKPPYIYAWKKPLSGGIAVDRTTVIDTTTGQYVIRDADGTFFQPDTPSDNYFMLVTAGSDKIKNGGPVYYHNNSIHYYQDKYSLMLPEVLFQGLTGDGRHIFQQIGAGDPPSAKFNSGSSETADEAREQGKKPEPETHPTKKE